MGSALLDQLFIFEMANSHQGSVEHGLAIIKEMGKIARKYNINAAVKLQYRNLETFIHPDFKDRTDVPHIPRFLGTRLDYDQFTQLVEAVREEGMVTMSTPFDEDGVDWCMDQGIDVIKIASCSALDWQLLKKVVTARKPCIVSTGGKRISDIDKIFNFMTHKKMEFALLHCVAEYPAPKENLQLDFMDRLKKRYPTVAIGYSGHEAPDDHVVPMLAAAKGACIYERHVGLPTDEIQLNAYSMNPEQADVWVKSILEAKQICTMKKQEDKYISQAELDSLNSLMRGVYLKHDVKQGERLSREDVFFAMPCQEGQMNSGEFTDEIIASKDYAGKEALTEKKVFTGIHVIRNVVHEAKGILYEAGIALGTEFEVELSHHYGMQHFRQFGAVLISIVNREYCKKLIIVLPGQKHPLHEHKVKEETFQLLSGDLQIELEGREIILCPGDIQTVLRGEMHSFTSVGGAVFEEISTTHVRNDSYYEDERISSKDPLERKSILRDW